MSVRNQGTRGDADTVISPDLAARDRRPGRPVRRPVAMMVDANPANRLRLRNDLTAAGYEVGTCPGPTAGVFCPAVRNSAVRCSRVLPRTSLVLLGETDQAAMVAAYERWLPGATISLALNSPTTPSLAHKE